MPTITIIIPIMYNILLIIGSICTYLAMTTRMTPMIIAASPDSNDMILLSLHTTVAEFIM